ncbi:MAG: hypothetical protein P8Y18_05320 [Candidatus Bathyarchaeota archaeon]
MTEKLFDSISFPREVESLTSLSTALRFGIDKVNFFKGLLINHCIQMSIMLQGCNRTATIHH